MFEKDIIVGEGDFRYRWIDNWVKIPVNVSSLMNGRTHGIAITSAENIIVFHQANPAVLIYNTEAKLLDSWGDNYRGAHGLCLVKEDNKDFLWLTDEFSGKVVKTNLSGQIFLQIQKPELAVYNENKYSPTWVAVNEERSGGNGDIWVTDGYGASVIHHYDKFGEYINSLTGIEGEAGRFNCPHSIWFDIRKPEHDLYIADRGNKRVQVYDADGNYKRTFGVDILTCPCAFTAFKDKLIIPELSAKLTILNRNDEVISFIGENEKTCSLPGWPDHSSEFIIPGKFNSPHSAAADSVGNIYVVEWSKGGRITKLEKI